jgi:peptidyl-prolyl cis-trans isomerase C
VFKFETMKEFSMHLRFFKGKIGVRILVAAMVLIPGAIGVSAQTPKPAPAATPQAAPKSASPAPAPVLQSATQSTQPPLFPKDMVIMTVGDHKITVAEFTQIMEMFPAQQRAYYTGPGKQKFADDFSQLLILSDEAKRRKLDDDPAVKQRIGLLVNQSLASSLIQSIQEGIKITDNEVQKYYTAHLKEYEEVKARHILIRTQGSRAPIPEGKKDLTNEEAKTKAEEIYKQVTAPGADFAAIAKAESYDKDSAQRGGDVGLFPHGRMVPEFEAAAFALKPGEISQPVKTQFGYHIIKVEENKTRSQEEAKSDIETTLRREKLEQSIDGVKKSEKIELNQQFFPPVSPPAPPSPPSPPPAAPPTEKKN